MTLSAMPKSIAENSLFGLFASLNAVLFALLYGFPQIFYETFVKNRLDGRKNIMVFQGLSPWKYHFGWAFCTTLVDSAEAIIIVVVMMFINAKVFGY